MAMGKSVQGQTGWIINSPSQGLRCLCARSNLCVYQIRTTNHRGSVFLLSQLYVRCHGESHSNVWVATGFICSPASSLNCNLHGWGYGLFCGASTGGASFTLWAQQLSAGSVSGPQMLIPAGGDYWWHVPAWNNTGAAGSGYEGREEPHLEIWQSHFGKK